MVWFNKKIILFSAGNSPVVKETRMEVGKGCDLNISSHSKTDGMTFPQFVFINIQHFVV